jgi:hypothetical protein
MNDALTEELDQRCRTRPSWLFRPWRGDAISGRIRLNRLF